MKPEIKLAVFVVVALLTWGGIFLVYRHSQNPQRKARSLAEKALYATVENPERIKVLAVSKADSIYGREYVTMEEQMNIAKSMMNVNREVMKATNGFENINLTDKRVTSLMERQMDAMSAMRSLVHPGKIVEHTKKNFTGWKVKIDYQAQTTDGLQYRSECWMFLDRDASCVVKSFEIPII